MGKALLEASRPAMWTNAVAADGGEVVRFGPHVIAVAEVEDVQLEEERDSYRSGLVLGAAAFAVVSSILTYLVFETGAMLRFLFGAGFLAMLASAGISELFTLKTLKIYEMRILMKDGSTARFASVDRDDIQALALKLTAARGS